MSGNGFAAIAGCELFAEIHGTAATERHEAGVHFCGNRPGMGSRLEIGGPDTPVWTALGEMFDSNWAAEQSRIRLDVQNQPANTVGGNRDTLDFALYYAMQSNFTSNGLQNNWNNVVNASESCVLGNCQLRDCNPNYADCDDERFQAVKPLLWLWYSFDRSPAGGQNVWLGVELRRLLATYIFKRCGENFKAFQNVEFSFGYSMEVGDNVVVHRNVLLDKLRHHVLFEAAKVVVQNIQGHLRGIEMKVILRRELQHAYVYDRVFVAGESDEANLARFARIEQRFEWAAGGKEAVGIFQAYVFVVLHQIDVVGL